MLPVVCAAALYAAAGPPCLPPEVAPLVESAPDRVGVPLEQEHPAADDPGALVQLTTGGLLYRSDDRPPTFTNGWARMRLGADGEMVEWEGESLDPPPPPPPVASAPTIAAPAPARQAAGGMPIGGALGARIYCIEGGESRHGQAMYNPVPVGREHAQGWLGFLPSTAARWGVRIGDRASEWRGAAAILAQGERFARSQFATLGGC